MNYKGAVFFDYDGTLADESREIYLPTVTTVNTISKLKEKGYAIFLATGRSKCYIPDTNGLFDGYVAANGSYCELNGEEIFSATMGKETIENLIETFLEMEIEYSFENQKNIFPQNIKSERYIKMLELFNIPTDILCPIEKIDYNSVCKGIALFNQDSELELLQRKYEKKLKFDRHRLYNSADVSIFGVNKGTGVRNVIEKMKIPFENTYAFGDGTNDVDMIKSVSYGIAMGESAPETAEAAKYITDTVINEGVTKAFKHYGLV